MSHLPRSAGHEVEESGLGVPVHVAGQIDHAGQLFRAPLAGIDVVPDMLIDTEGGDVLEPGLIGGERDESGFDGPPYRFPRRAQLPGKTRNRGVFAAQLPERSVDAALRDRSSRRDKGRQLLHERLPRAVFLVTAPHALPPPDAHSRRAGHIMKYSSSTPSSSRDDTARRAPGRRRGARDRHHQHVITAVDMLDMHTIDAEQQITAGTRTGRAHVRAHGSRVKHVEVLVKISELALLILRDLDPYPSNLTRRALPPPKVRRALLPSDTFR